MSYLTGYISFIQLFKLNAGDDLPAGGEEIPDGELPEGPGELLFEPSAFLYLPVEVEIVAPEVIKVTVDPGTLLFDRLTVGTDAGLTILRIVPGQLIIQGNPDPLFLVLPSEGDIIYQSPAIDLIGGFMPSAGEIIYSAPGIEIVSDLTILHPETATLLMQSPVIYLRVVDAVKVVVIKEETLTETLFAWETLGVHRGFPVADTMAMVDSVQVKLVLLLNEYISIRDTLTSQWTGNLSVSENMTMVDTVSWVRALYLTISETFAIVDAPVPHLSLILNEYLQVKDAVTAQGVFTKTLSETLAMTDTVVVGWLLSLLETMAIADAVTVIKSVNETVNETMTMTDVLSASGVFNVRVTETANLSDYAKDCVALYLSESLVMTDGVTCFSEMFLTLAETMGFTEALSVAAETTLSVSENIIFIDSVSSQGVLYNTIQDGFHLDISIELDGEVYECWVLNTPGFYPSIYSGFDFNSYCEYKGVPYGANATGIFKLTGDTDNGAAIHTGAILHSTDFGARNDKRFRKAYIGLSGDAPAMIMEADNGDRIKYAIDSKGKVDASRSVHSRDWVLSVGEFDELESIHLVPVILARGK